MLPSKVPLEADSNSPIRMPDSKGLPPSVAGDFRRQPSPASERVMAKFLVRRMLIVLYHSWKQLADRRSSPCRSACRPSEPRGRTLGFSARLGRSPYTNSSGRGQPFSPGVSPFLENSTPSSCRIYLISFFQLLELFAKFATGQVILPANVMFCLFQYRVRPGEKCGFTTKSTKVTKRIF